MKVDHVQLLVDGDMSGDLDSIGILIDQMALASIQATFSGAPVGSLELQASNDIVPYAPVPGNPVGPDPAANVTNWTTITCSVTPITAAGNFLWNIPNAGYRWVRLHYTATSGTGSLSATFSGKG